MSEIDLDTPTIQSLSAIPGRWKSAAAQLGLSSEEYARERRSERKWCYACGSFLPVIYFRANAAQPDGLRSECNHCHQLQKYAQRQRKRSINSQGLTTIIRVPQRRSGQEGK